MAFASGQAPGSTKVKEIPFSTSVEAFPMKNNQAYASEPDLDAEKAKNKAILGINSILSFWYRLCFSRTLPRSQTKSPRS